MQASSITMAVAAALLRLRLAAATSAAAMKLLLRPAVAKSLLLAVVTPVAAVVVIIVIIAVTACSAAIADATAHALQLASQFVLLFASLFVLLFVNRPAAKSIRAAVVIAVIMAGSIIAVIMALAALRPVTLAVRSLEAAVAACKPNVWLEAKPSRPACEQAHHLKQRTAASLCIKETAVLHWTSPFIPRVNATRKV